MALAWLSYTAPLALGRGVERPRTCYASRKALPLLRQRKGPAWPLRGAGGAQGAHQWRSSTTRSRGKPGTRYTVPRDGPAEPVFPPSQDDTRSPLERFRTKPKKPLSVTDLVSPAWCELQYYYNLSHFGRVPRTRQMKQGSKIHKTLEDEVHEIVPVQVKSKEDRFGLNLWNTIQGLRTLKATGMTRELKIWGVIQGQVVNAVVDELSYTCPDPAYEEAMEKAKIKKAGGTLPLESGQLTLAQTLALGEQDRDNWSSQKSERTVYVSDVKTRGSKTVPIGASLRSTWMQLMLYRRLLESLALNTVDAQIIFDRYDLRPLELFTEVFMQDVDDMNKETKSQADDENPFSVLQTSEVNEYNNLTLLWSLMITEFQSTFVHVSEVLRAEFRYAATGEIIGSDVFAYASSTIESYIEDEMTFWKGEREVKGVEIEEAFKCRSCDFGDTCEWRRKKIDEATEKHRLRVKGPAKSAV
ncbi:exonuclease V a 5' deoxyribonuclease-domain-containing protein [Lophiotrema nucula]|uniref:Exonuclease V a 5' deoxyribonuclease-domain-containing protein n=1 Tax=Lophiotrema nucula TaxID=690887 RepID=A0A6A5Z8X0_9PLEO|nr:exonuclease V a 5' deoxyribonuclease-domain-containing protein [Lophiotrema nucula]